MMSLRSTYPLHPKKIIKKTVSTVVSTVWMGGLIVLCGLSSLLAELAAENPSGTLMAGLAFLFIGIPLFGAIVYLYQKEYFKVYEYDLSGRGLEIKKGVFFPKSITLPLEKISDVYVDKDIFDRMFGLYDLHFSSASLGSGNLSHIDGMDKATTDSLRTFLMRHIRGENAGMTEAARAGGADAAAANGSSGAGAAGAGREDATMAAGGAKAAEIEEARELAVFKPDPKGYWVDVAGMFMTLFLMLLFMLPLFFELLALALPLTALGLLLAAAMAVYAKMEFDSQIYTLRSDGIYVRRGWLTPSETLIFYKNIQDIDSVQTFLGRLVGIRTLTVKSMSFMSASSSMFTALNAADAKSMHDMLTAEIEKLRHAQKKIPREDSTAGASGPAEAEISGYAGEIRTNPYQNEFVLGGLAGGAMIYVPLALLSACILLAGSLLGAGEAAAWLAGIIFGLDILLVGGIVVGAIIEKFVYSYALGPDGLTIQTGVFARFKKTIRYEKVQDIRIYCGFVESFFGLATIQIETGSRDIIQSRTGEVGVMRTERIPHLKLADAYALRAKLLETTAMTYPKNASPLRASMPLSPKKPLKKTVAAFGIFGVQVLLILLLACVLIPQPFSLVAVGLLALFLVINAISVPVRLWYEKLYMTKYFYDENGQVLIIRKGVFGWSEIVVPYRNIQSIYVDQDWYDVYYDLWDVWITTVTSASGPMAHIDGLERDDAERLARLLVERVENSRKR